MKKLVGATVLVVIPLVVVRATDRGGDAPAVAETVDAAAAIDPTASSGAQCVLESGPHALPDAIRESSGVAHTRAGSLWTHNDGSEAVLYRVGEAGAIEQTVRVTGANASDVEDIDAGPCPDGSGDCLWLADTGDNDGERGEVALLIVREPAADATAAAATRVSFAYPDGPRDAEALAILPGGGALVLTKGRDTPIGLYRLAGAAADRAPGGARTPRVAERVAQLRAEPDGNRNRLTGAGASEGGAWIAVRTNDALALHRTDALLAGQVTPALTFDVRGLRETQGEGVDVAADGRVWLTSEGERGSPTLARLRCTLPE